MDGTFYYAVTDPNHPGALLLSATPGGAPLQLDLSPVLTSPDGAQTYTISAIDADSSSFLFDPAQGYRFSAGQPLVYQGTLGTAIPGLTSGTTYYAVVDDLSSRERPAGVFRRTYFESGGRRDEAFTRSLVWERSASLVSAERGDLQNKFVEITEDEANQIVARIRAEVTGTSNT